MTDLLARLQEDRRARDVLGKIASSIKEMTKVVGCDGNPETPGMYALYTHNRGTCHNMVAKVNLGYQLVVDKNRVPHETIGLLAADYPDFSLIAANAVYDDGHK